MDERGVFESKQEEAQSVRQKKCKEQRELEKKGDLKATDREVSTHKKLPRYYFNGRSFQFETHFLFSDPNLLEPF